MWEEEQVGDLPVEANRCDGESDRLVQVRLVGTERLLCDKVGQLVHPTPVFATRDEGLGEHLAAADPRIEGGSDLLEVPHKQNANDPDGTVDNGVRPLHELRPKGPRNARRNEAQQRELQEVGDGHGVSRRLGELQLQRGEDREARRPKRPDGGLQPGGVLHRLHANLQLPLRQLVHADLVNIGDAVPVLIQQAVSHVSRIDDLDLVEHKRQMPTQALASHCPKCLHGGDERHIGPAEEAHNQSQHHLDVIHRQR
mmetsp:Transcript_39254/g.113451  ORF Transcript_39254/g.113451 Transcript_39254/m.113451 type:complete len:255 (-) Transcript_39254:428-1192(-)